MKTLARKRFCDRWCQHLTYTIRMSEIEEWFEKFGSFGQRDGRLWKPQIKMLTQSDDPMIEVHFVEYS